MRKITISVDDFLNRGFEVCIFFFFKITLPVEGGGGVVGGDGWPLCRGHKPPGPLL